MAAKCVNPQEVASLVSSCSRFSQFGQFRLVVSSFTLGGTSSRCRL
jgi:hypothetical protein